MAVPNIPNLERLTRGLSEVFSRGSSNGHVAVLSRKPNPYGSTFPTEIVTCRLNSGGVSKLFVKYGTREFDGIYGHRGNVAYEAEVYGKVLEPLGISTPKFYGAYKDRVRKNTWMITEYMGGGYPASWLRDPTAMIRSASWIGKFHAANEKRHKTGGFTFLRKYDASYYRGWARRTRRLFRDFHSRFPWLRTLCDEFEKEVPTLLEAPQTIIHGEYFGSNILYQRGLSRPTDWQSAAVAAGEVDLASLTHSWNNRIVESCMREYKRSRWPHGIPKDFPRTFEVARAYMSLRWLGDPGLMSSFVKLPKKSYDSKNIFLTMQAMLELHLAGKRLGLVE